PLRAETVRRTLALGSTVLALLALSWLPTGADEPTSRHDDGLRSALPDTFALTGAKIVVDPSTVIDSGTLVVSRGKIVAVGADAVIPPGARTIDASGRTLLAAPIDPYAPVAVTTDPADNATYWNEQIRPERRAVVGLRPDAAADAAWRAQGFAARNFAPDAGVLRGYGALLLLDDAPVDRRVLAADATQHALLTLSARGARGSYPSSPMGAYALARQAMYDAQWYAEARRIAEVDPSVERPEYNRSLEALGGVLDRSVPLVVETSNDAFVLRADRYAREFGLTLIVVGSGNEYRRVDEIAATGRALILPVDFPGPPDVATAERAAQTSLESLMHWDLAPENPARLHAAGVRFALTGNGLSDPKQFWPNLRKAIERGLPASTALAALTVVPAEMLGVADQVGTLHPGKVANFIVCDGSPLESEAKLIETWVAGSRFEIAPVAERRAEGRWQLEFSGGLPTAVIALTGDDASLKGAWERPHVPSPAIEGSEGAAETAKPEPIRFRQIGIGDWRVAGLVPGEALQQQGTLQLTLTIRPEAP
ncbi:MAG TPA: amidohydrolase family protein, partial [Pirellulaceae bacterium]|nr:amidohydrolase family protein [Pirellulaceae bacterium]